MIHRELPALSSDRGLIRLSSRRIRVCLGALWLLDAALQSRPEFFGYGWWHDDLVQSVMGQPGPISRSILWATGLLAAHSILVNTLAVAVQMSIGLCLVIGRYERAAIAVSVPWALAVWWVGEGLGALPTGFGILAGGAPGAVLLYPLIGLICWPTPETGSEGGSRRAGVGARAGVARGAWLVLFVGGAVASLPWRFPASVMLQANIEENALGQPLWLSHIAHVSYRAVGSHPVLLPYLLIGLEVAVGLGVLGRRSRPYALVAGGALALLFWVTVQSLGGLAAGSTTDPNSAPLLVLLALTVVSVTDCSRPGPTPCAGSPPWAAAGSPAPLPPLGMSASRRHRLILALYPADFRRRDGELGAVATGCGDGWRVTSDLI